MMKLFFILVPILFTSNLFAERGTVMLSCDAEGATVYVDNERKTRLRKGVTSFRVEEGKHVIKVVEYVNNKCQRYVEKELIVIAKDSIPLSMKLEESVEPTSSYRNKVQPKKSSKNSRFNKTRCHVVKDEKLKVMWQDNEVYNRTKNLNDAQKYCQELELSLFDDWRLPSYSELLSIVDYAKFNPAIVPTFQHTFSSKYWSSSQDVAAPAYAWFVDFKYGKTGPDKKSKKYYTRCIRDN